MRACHDGLCGTRALRDAGTLHEAMVVLPGLHRALRGQLVVPKVKLPASSCRRFATRRPTCATPVTVAACTGPGLLLLRCPVSYPTATPQASAQH